MPTTEITSEPLPSKQKTARKLDVSVRTVERLISAGKLRTVRVSPNCVRVTNLPDYLSSLQGVA